MPKKKKQTEVRLPKIEQLPSGSWRTRIYMDGRTVSITKPTYDECLAEYLALKHGVIAAKKPPGRAESPWERLWINT